MYKIFMTLSLGLAGAIIAQSAHAQGSNCADRTSIVAQLEKKYGETAQSVGLGRDNGVLEMFASTETGTWTIILTKPSGMTCLMAAGEAFQDLDGKTKKTDSDA